MRYVLAFLTFATLAVVLANHAIADDPHSEGCVQVVAVKRFVVFANQCDPSASVKLDAKAIPFYSAE